VMLTGGDPIDGVLVKSLAKPGGNITGLTAQSLDATAKTRCYRCESRIDGCCHGSE